MIIECINCNKKFSVNSDLIPDEGRTIQCGSCNHVWFFKKKDQIVPNIVKPDVKKKIIKPTKKDDFKISQKLDATKDQIFTKKDSSLDIIEYKAKPSFTFVKFLHYILVFIISFIGLIIVLDTFKTPLYNLIPNLEFLLFSFFETLKDIELFIRDLI